MLQTSLRAVKRYSPEGTEIMIVDNASTDVTSEELRRLRADGQVRVVNLPRNLYHGPAMDLGFLLARTEHVVALDVDAFPTRHGWLGDLLAPLAEGKTVSGARAERGYVHPCCLAMRLSDFARARHTFSPHHMGDESLALLDADWDDASDMTPYRWDTGESISRREGAASCHALERTSVRGPLQLGSVFGELVYHNGASTRIAAGETVDGLTLSDVRAAWSEARDRYLPDERARVAPGSPERPPVELTVVIPARNAAVTIHAQLEALSAQTWSDGSWEVLVVDNRSTDDTAAIVERFAAADGRFFLVDAVDGSGAAYARNVGTRSTSAPLVAFCDADDIVGDEWVSAMGDALRSDPFVTGPIDIERLNPPWLAGSQSSALLQSRSVFEGIFPFASSCNFGARRSDLVALGGFDESFETGEDLELSMRIWMAGISLRFEPTASIHYRFRPTLAASFHRACAYGAVRPRLGDELRSAGRAAPSRLMGIKNWIWLARHVAMLRNRPGQARWLWVAGTRVGNIVGSVRTRSLYL